MEDIHVRLLCSVTRAADILDISRSKLYELLACGAIRPVKIGRSTRIPMDELHDYVERLRQENK